MDIKKEYLRVSVGATDEKGDKLEPEEQQVDRVMTVDANVTSGGGMKQEGSMAINIVASSSVIDLATRSKGLCGNCRYFDNKTWRRDLERIQSPFGSIIAKKMLNELRMMLLQTGNANLKETPDGDIDLEGKLQEHGYCKALFAVYKDRGESNEDATVLVIPESSCPAEFCNETQPLGWFRPINKAAEKTGVGNYDRLLNAARGK